MDIKPLEEIDRKKRRYNAAHEFETANNFEGSFDGFIAGCEYQAPISYEEGFQDGFKKQDNEMYNQAIDDVLKEVVENIGTGEWIEIRRETLLEIIENLRKK